MEGEKWCSGSMSPQLAFVWMSLPKKKKKKKKNFFFFFRETPTSPWVPFRVKFRPLGRLFRPSRPLAWSLYKQAKSNQHTWMVGGTFPFIQFSQFKGYIHCNVVLYLMSTLGRDQTVFALRSTYIFQSLPPKWKPKQHPRFSNDR